MPNGTWCVSWPTGNGPETRTYPTEDQAVAEARRLHVAGQPLAVAWYNTESTGPWVDDQLDGAA